MRFEAPAKVNLFLHVTGRRADGYHELESLVVFERAVCDVLTISPDTSFCLALAGPFASEVAPDQNSVLAAARLLTQTGVGQGVGAGQGAHIHLEKNLPVAAGIGGGSADAAAALKGLNAFWQLGLEQADLAALGLKIGADVPVCLQGVPTLMGGIGEILSPAPPLPDFALLLVNPLIGVSTGAVFAALRNRANAKAPSLPTLPDADGFARWLAEHTRNDLQPAAYGLYPELAEVQAMLEETEALLVRMSGSGATHFGLYATPDAAQAAGTYLRRRYPGWWINQIKKCSRPCDHSPSGLSRGRFLPLIGG